MDDDAVVLVVVVMCNRVAVVVVGAKEEECCGCWTTTRARDECQSVEVVVKYVKKGFRDQNNMKEAEVECVRLAS